MVVEVVVAAVAVQMLALVFITMMIEVKLMVVSMVLVEKEVTLMV